MDRISVWVLHINPEIKKYEEVFIGRLHFLKQPSVVLNFVCSSFISSFFKYLFIYNVCL